MEFKIITGTASECEKQINDLAKKYNLVIRGTTSYNNVMAIILELVSEKNNNLKQ